MTPSPASPDAVITLECAQLDQRQPAALTLPTWPGHTYTELLLHELTWVQRLAGESGWGLPTF